MRVHAPWRLVLSCGQGGQGAVRCASAAGARGGAARLAMKREAPRGLHLVFVARVRVLLGVCREY